VNSISLSVDEMLRDDEYGLKLRLVSGGAGLDHRVTSPRIQKPGLALTGYLKHMHPDRVQVLGSTEISYLQQLPEDVARSNCATLCSLPISCFIITKGQEPPVFLIEETERGGIPLLVTPHQSSTFISLISKYLEERLLPMTHIHGVLVDVLGVGILILGKSGIGKSECALELVIRGNRLVADDVVNIKKRMPASLIGQAGTAIQHHMEIRGLGIINVKDMFGVASIREKKLVDIVIELVDWDPQVEYDRLGLDDQVYTILGVDLRYLVVPVRPGRDIASIIQVAARNFLLKLMGYHSAREFQERLLTRMEARPLGDEVE
jgi:HPr kinase/phosphorylase